MRKISSILILFCFSQLQTQAQSVSVGATDGVFDVSDMGAATYSIPIKLPAGIGGVQPSISLNYNSQGGNGILGMGWSLSATSAVTRAGKNIYLDKKVDGIDGTADDQFALDGNRLMLMSGTYGAAAATYATEIESFRKITANGASNTTSSYFTVTDQNGWTYTYGAPTVATVNVPGTTVPLMWLLYQVTDLNGNMMQYDYAISPGEEPRITNISYTATTGSIANTVVSFNYEERPDPNFGCVAGGRLYQSKRLTSIAIRGRDAGGSLVNVRSYVMGYTTDAYTHLVKVTEKGSEAEGTPESLSPTTFEYGTTTAMLDVVTHTEIANGPEYSFTSGDYNGDGKSDIIKFSTEIGAGSYELHLSNHGDDNFILSDMGALNTDATVAGYKNAIWPSQQTRTIPFDYNGDGKDDFVYFQEYQHPTTPTNNKQKYWVYLSDSSSINSIEPIVSRADLGYSTIIGGTVPVVGDFDGDGKSEILAISKFAATEYQISYLIGEKYNVLTTTLGYAALKAKSFSWSVMMGINASGSNQVFAIDYNGDGKQELLNIRDGQSYLYELNVTFDEDNNPVLGSSPFNLVYSGTYPSILHKIFPGDFNGDGITDLLSWVDGTGWQIGYGKGSGQYDIWPFSLMSIKPECPTLGGSFRAIIVQDFNGDGKSDIYDYTGSDLSPCAPYYQPRIFYSKGGNNFSEEVLSVSTANIGKSVQVYVAGDYNGDGASELMTRRTVFSSDYNYILSFHSNETRHQIIKITNGLGSETGIAYRPLSDENLYTSGTTTYSFPFIKRTLPFKVASTITVDNMSSAGTDITYSYKGLKYHTLGKGLLGFDNITKKDVLRNRTEEKTFRINTTYAFPYLQRVLTKQGAFTMSIASNIYSVYDYGSKRIFPYISKTSFTDEISLRNKIQMFDYSTASGQINPFTIGKPRIITTLNGYNPLVIIDMEGTPLPVEKIVETSTFVASGSTAAAYIKSKPVSVLSETTRESQPLYSRKVNFTYNTTNGQIATMVTDPATTNTATTTFTYNGFGNLTKKVLAATGLTTRTENIEYDPSNRFVKTQYNSTFPNTKTINTYDMLTGWLTQSTEADGLVTNYTYDGFGRTKTVSNSNGKSVTTNYLWSEGHPYTTTIAASQYVIETIPNTEAASYVFYDRLGRVTRQANKGFNGQMIFVDDRYDGKGRLVRHSNPYFEGGALANTTYGYDDYDRMTGENPVGDDDIDYTYTTLENTYEVTTTNVAGQSKKVTTDRSGKMVVAEDEGGVLSYLYHSNGNLKEVKLGSTVVQTTEYDAYGRKTKETDPNYGSYIYTYNAFGEVKTSQDPKAQVYNYAYNQLGDITTKTGPEGTYTYTYGTATGANCGKLTKIVGPEGIEESSFGMGEKITWQKATIGTEILTTEYTYDTYGRTQTVKYPNATTIEYKYNATTGDIATIGRPGATVTFPMVGAVPAYMYSILDKNAFGQIMRTGYQTQFYSGSTSGETDISHYFFSFYNKQEYTDIGLLSSQYSSKPPSGMGPGLLRHVQYDFNEQTGNLTWRKDIKNNRWEQFTYDDLNRLTLNQPQIISPASSIVGGSGIDYSNNGNILSKSDAGTFTYDIANRVSEIQPFYNIPTTIQTATYKPFNKVADITEGAWQAVFTYGPSGERNQMLLKEGGVLKKTKYYGADYEKEIDAATGIIRELCYIRDDNGNYVAIIEKKEGVESTYYTLTDHLGSITHIIKDAAVVEERSFDPWGRYRNPTTWATIAPTAVSNNFDRGYTGHEYLPKFGIINMNGRLYDPVMGRMFSADPYIIGAGSSQGFNRYSYVLNNPLSIVDPDGNHPLIVALAVGAIVGAGSYTYSVANSPGGFSNWNWGHFVWRTGFGAVSGTMTFGIGEAFAGAPSSILLEAGRAGAHGVSGFITSGISGGNPGRGFVAGAVGSVSGSLLSGIPVLNTRVGGTLAASVTGGITTSILGGNFFEGAAQATLVHLLNQELHNADSKKTGKPKGNGFRPGKQKDRDGDMTKYPRAFRDWYHRNKKDYVLPGEPDPDLDPIYKEWLGLGSPEAFIKTVIQNFKYTLEINSGIGLLKWFNNHLSVPCGCN